MESISTEQQTDRGRLIIFSLVCLHLIFLLIGDIQLFTDPFADKGGLIIAGLVWNIVELGLLTLFLLKSKKKLLKVFLIFFMVIEIWMFFINILQIKSNLDDYGEVHPCCLIGEIFLSAAFVMLMFKKFYQPFFDNGFKGIFDPIKNAVSKLVQKLEAKLKVKGEEGDTPELTDARTLAFVFILAAWACEFISWIFWCFAGEKDGFGEIISFIIRNLAIEVVVFGPFIVQTFLKGKAPEENWWWLLIDGVAAIGEIIWTFKELKGGLAQWNDGIGQANAIASQVGSSERLDTESMPAGIYFYVAFGVISGIFCLLAAIRLIKNKKLIKKD